MLKRSGQRVGDEATEGRGVASGREEGSDTGGGEIQGPFACRDEGLL